MQDNISENVSEIQILQERIARLEQETQERNVQMELKHKAQTVRHRLVLGLVVVGMSLTLLTQKGLTDAKSDLVVRSLKVVDDDGVPVVSLYADKNLWGQIAIHGAAGKRVAQIGVDPDGWGGAWFYDGEGKTMQASIGTNKNGEGVVWTKK